MKNVSENGRYDRNTNTIHIDINAGNDYSGVMLFTLSHELTHFIRNWSPAQFKKLSDFLISEYGKAGVDVMTLARNQMNKAKSHGHDMTIGEAYEEVVADAMSKMLVDPEAYEKLAKLKKENKTLWQKIKDFILNFIERITNAYEDAIPDSEEARLVDEKLSDSFGKLRDLFVEGLVGASENYAKAGDVMTEDGENKFSFRGIRADGIEVYETSEEIKNLPYKERQKVFLDLMKNQYRGRTAKFTRNGETYYARFDDADTSVLTVLKKEYPQIYSMDTPTGTSVHTVPKINIYAVGKHSRKKRFHTFANTPSLW